MEVYNEDVIDLTVCRICQRKFSSEEELNNHIREPALTRNYRCCACGQATKCAANLHTHTRIHTGDRPYVCGICSKEFKRNEHLKTHMKTHTKENQYECSNCGKKYTRLENLSRHVKVHTNHTPFTCSICNKQFERKDILNHHRRIHFDQKNKKKNAEMPGFECDICSRVCLSHRDLKHHRIIHKGPFICEICKMTFTRKDTQNVHMKIHTGEKPLSCHICKKVFRWQTSLKRHIEFCRRNLSRHSKMAHVSEICEERLKKEHNQNNKNRHMKMQSAEPFSCDTCKKVFGYKKNLKRHISNICGRNLAHSISVKDHTMVDDNEKLGDVKKLEQNGQTIADHNKNNVFMKIEPEEPQIVEVKIEQEEHYDIGDARKLDPNGQTITGRKENNTFMKVEPEEPQIIKQERVYLLVKQEQEEYYVMGDARKLELNGETIAGDKENNTFRKVEPEEPQINEQERIFPHIEYEI